MGSRGAGSGRGNTANTENGIQALTVITSDGTRLEFEKHEGKYYNTTGRMPEELPSGITFKSITENAALTGATVEKLTPKDIEKKRKENAAYRAEMDEFLNREYARNRHADQNNKAYRNSRRSQRISKRNNR